MDNFSADKANAERKARIERMAATREQILNAKYDAAALRREAAWFRKNGGAK